MEDRISVLPGTDGESLVVEGDIEDRISVLPGNVIDRILALLPIRDAAKTCILSKSWRYIWPELPYLVLDYEFCSELIEGFEYESYFREVVDRILLLHVGRILKFDLDAIVEDLATYDAADAWLLYVTRNNVKKLYLRLSNIGDLTYELPPCVFNCQTITHLKLASCSFKPPSSFLGFPNLVTLRFASVIFSENCVLKAPLLDNMTLNSCDGTEHLTIVSRTLKTVYVHRNQSYIELSCLMNCKNLRELGLFFHQEVENPNHDQRSMLVNVLASLPSLEVLLMDLLFVELLSAGIVPNGLPFILNCLCSLSLYVDFGKLNHCYCAIQLIKSSPNLNKLDVLVGGARDEEFEAVLKYLDTSSCLEVPLRNLKYVNFHGFARSKGEQIFVKLLLSRSPSLLRMSFKHPVYPNPEEIPIKLSCFSIATPRAEIVVI